MQNVACVVHYQLPAAADMYVHRCGRTARAAAEGIALALVTPKESARFGSLRKVVRSAMHHGPMLVHFSKLSQM